MTGRLQRLQSYAEWFGLPPLRTSIEDRNGMRVQLDEVMWQVASLGTMPTYVWSQINVTPVLEYSLRAWFAYRIETCAPGTVARDFPVLQELMVSTRWPPFELSHRHATAVQQRLKSALLTFVDAHRANDQTGGTKKLEAYLERIRGWYLWSARQELPGFDEAFTKELLEIRAPSRRNGEAVMSWDPTQGPLTRLEELQFRAKLLADLGSLSRSVAIWLTYGMGLRPMQSILLLEQDLKVFAAPNGDKFYQLDVPRIKQKNGLPMRGELKRRKIGKHLGALLEQLILQHKAIETPSGVERPILVRSEKEAVKRLNGPARRWAYVKHHSYISNALRKFVVRHKIISVRTGKRLNLTPRRLRYTFGTNKAETLEPSVLAELLDHSDTRSVLVYYNARESIGEELGRKLAKNNGPTGYKTVIDAFAGVPIKVIARTKEADIGGPPTRRFIPHEMLTDNMRELPGLGNCGGNYKCGKGPIVSCYGCDDFNAWDDADHREVVEWLAKEIEHLRSLPETAESTIHDFELALVRANQICDEITKRAASATG